MMQFGRTRASTSRSFPELEAMCVFISQRDALSHVMIGNGALGSAAVQPGLVLELILERTGALVGAMSRPQDTLRSLAVVRAIALDSLV